MEQNQVVEAMTDEQLLARAAELQSQVDALRVEELNEEAQAKEGKVKEGKVKKNQKPGKASATRKYVLLSKELKSWGKVPQQQADIARLLAGNIEVGKEVTEGELFDLLQEKAADFASLAISKQDPTYLFRHYRGLKNDGKHAGFIARDFVRVVEAQ